MSIDLILPVPQLSETEEQLLLEIYKTNPVLEKHYKIMALNDVKELLALSGSDRPAEEVALAHEHVRGKLSTTATLLAFIESLKFKETVS